MNLDYIKEDVWFAWHPVKTKTGWVFLANVKRIIDERPLVYLGLTEEIEYEQINTASAQ